MLFLEHRCVLDTSKAAYVRSHNSHKSARRGSAVLRGRHRSCVAVWTCTEHDDAECAVTTCCRHRHVDGRWEYRIAHKVDDDFWYVHGAHTGWRRRSVGWFKLLP